jgi:nicotinamide-nucleotide amidase
MISELAVRLLSQGRQLVTAESCTGGWIAKACTDLPGSSRWYRGGVVVYTDELKVRLLGVQRETLLGAGAVSEATVREMALGALERLGGKVAVAVSGIAGPDGGTPSKPVGTVWVAWASRSDAGPVVTRARLGRFGGDREQVRREAVAMALAGALEA